MATKKLQGITIEIGGNTTKLNDALKGVNSSIYAANNELKALDKALKLDPKNTELLSQKYELLEKNIQDSTNKLNQLKTAQSQMGDYNKLTDDQKESYRELTREITTTENAIKNMKNSLSSTNSINLSKIGDTLKKVGDIAAEVVKKVAQVVTAVSTAIAGVLTAGVKSYAELEQNIGGVETLFKDNADAVIENANKAYETAGLSANEYMSTVTSVSASLLQSLGGDTAKAADVADMALIDMADNANKFGTSMDSIQNAYQGFAKQNYTMLDNLKLGYGGTKTEMERLLSDAEKISGVKYDISNLSDVYNAIHVVQEELGVTGTTALEASTTISGSMASMKAAFDNFLNGSGSPEQLSNAIVTFITNVSNVIIKLAPQILGGISTLIANILPQIGQLLINMLPQLFEAAQQLIASLVDLIKNNVQPIADMVTSLLMSLVAFILENLPTIIETGLQVLLALISGISENLDVLIPAVVDAILMIVEVLIDNIDLIIEAAIKLMLGLAEGIVKAIPRIVAKIPELIAKLIKALGDGVLKVVDIGKNLVSGIWKGISNSFDWIKSKIKGWVGNVLKFIKKLFGINSPSTVMRDQIGENLGYGMVEGIDNTVSDVQKAMKNLSSKVETSVNPVINPTANNNPLYIQIENFNNTRQTDIQALAEELEFYRRNSATAKGSN